jgi:hypothetical protein
MADSDDSLQDLAARDKKTLESVVKFAEQDIRTAQLSLAIFYMGTYPQGDYDLLGFALHIPQKADPKQSAKWWRRAADSGDTESQFQIGQFFETGYGVKQDRALAFKYYKKSGLQGHAVAQRKVGNMLLGGDGVSLNRPLGVDWLKKAAAQNDACAQWFLGLVYEKIGRAQKKPMPMAESRTWLKKASDLGHKESSFYLGEIFRKGDGVDINVHQARKYLRRAAVLGHAGAIESLKDLCMCSFCGSRGAMRMCQCCLKARYCNRDCQLKHWNGVSGVSGVSGEKHSRSCPRDHEKTIRGD